MDFPFIRRRSCRAAIAMRTPKPGRFSKPPSKMTNDPLFDLPSLPDDFAQETELAPSFREQMAHAQLLLSWRRTQGLETPHPPRNEEKFLLPPED
jgi:hypothetical protein